MIEGVDFYFNDQGLMVFTAAYHLKRGYCCKNKCKHCPWKYGKAQGKDTSKGTIKQSTDANEPTRDELKD